MTVGKRLTVTVPAALVVFAGAAVLAPAPSGATQCGPGTVYDAPTDTCVIPPVPVQWNAPPPPAPPPPLAPPPAPPPPPPSILPPGMPPLQVCPPIPFVPVCFPIN